jgi:transposase
VGGSRKEGTGPTATWLWTELSKLGLPVICIDARHARAALKMQINKSDRNDAVGIARIMQCGWYKEVARQRSRQSRKGGGPSRASHLLVAGSDDYSDARLHADEAAQHVREPRLDLAAWSFSRRTIAPFLSHKAVALKVRR